MSAQNDSESLQLHVTDSRPADDKIYPRLLRRVRAVLIDSVLIGVIFVVWLLALPRLQDLHYLLKLAALIGPVLLIEPGMVSLTGGTPGHHMMKLRIRDASRDRNIGFLRATTRTIVRAFLGWLSFVFVLITRKHQALHDYATHTVVVLRRPETLPDHEKFSTRIADDARYIYPSKTRRSSIIVLYNLLGLLGLGVLNAALISAECFAHHRCGQVENVLAQLLSLFWLGFLGITVVAGWRGYFMVVAGLLAQTRHRSGMSKATCI